MILSVGLWRSGGWDFTGLGPEEGLGHTAPEREKDMWVVVKIKVPFLGTLNNRCRIIIRDQKGTIIFDNHPCARSSTAPTKS